MATREQVHVYFLFFAFLLLPLEVKFCFQLSQGDDERNRAPHAEDRLAVGNRGGIAILTNDFSAMCMCNQFRNAQHTNTMHRAKRDR